MADEAHANPYCQQTRQCLKTKQQLFLISQHGKKKRKEFFISFRFQISTCVNSASSYILLVHTVCANTVGVSCKRQHRVGSHLDSLQNCINLTDQAVQPLIFSSNDEMAQIYGCHGQHQIQGKMVYTTYLEDKRIGYKRKCHQKNNDETYTPCLNLTGSCIDHSRTRFATNPVSDIIGLNHRVKPVFYLQNVRQVISQTWPLLSFVLLCGCPNLSITCVFVFSSTEDAHRSDDKGLCLLLILHGLFFTNPCASLYEKTEKKREKKTLPEASNSSVNRGHNTRPDMQLGPGCAYTGHLFRL